MLTKTKYGIFSKKFGSNKYNFIRGYNTYKGAVKALNRARYLKLDSRVEVSVRPYTSYQPAILLAIALIIIAFIIL